MHTPGHHRRAPIRGRRLAATASLVAFAIVGAAFGAGSPASADGTTPNPAAIATAAVTPLVRLATDHAGVTAGDLVTFTATETAPDGTPIGSEPAAFYVHTIHGWLQVATKTLSAEGSVTFTFRPNFDHAYRVDFAAVDTDGVSTYNAVQTADVTVTAKPVDIGPAIVAAAAKEKGRRYVFGADGPNTFDCSGLTKFVFHKFGINLPHRANLQKRYGVRVSRANAEPGDLVFVFAGSFAHHVAIYAGHGTWWEAPHTGASVRHVKIWSNDIEFRHVR